MIEQSDHSDESKYVSLQYALYSTAVVLVFGGLSYLYTVNFVVTDKNNCKMLTQDTSGLIQVHNNDSSNEFA